MKKIKLLICYLLLGSAMMVCACSKSNIDKKANVSFENEIIATGKGVKLTVEDVYGYIVNNQGDEISKNILTKIMKNNIDFKEKDIKTLYERYLSEYFESTFVESGSYNYNGKFSEDLVVRYLKSEGYIVECGVGITPSIPDNENFKCNYASYVEKEVNYDIYSKILKVQYLLEKKSQLIDKSKARRITYYTESKGSSDNEVREAFESYVSSFEINQTAADDQDIIVKNIADVAEKQMKKELDKISEEWGYLYTSKDSSSGYNYLTKFTTCGNIRCSIEEGKKYQEKVASEKEYYTTKIVIDDGSTVLYEAADELLFSDNIENYLYSIGEINYLMSPAYLSSNVEEQRVNDIILYDSANSKYYLVAVEVINSHSDFEDKVLVAELLLDKISDSTIIEYCYENTEIEIYDQIVREYYVSKYGKYDK